MKRIFTLSMAVVLFGTGYVKASDWITLEAPGALYGTNITGIDGGNIVGYYLDSSRAYVHGVLYNGTTWTIIDKPGANLSAGTAGTYIQDLDGSTIVGYYYDFDRYGAQGFRRWSGGSYERILFPNANDTYITGIDGVNLAGKYIDSVGFTYGFLYDGASWKTFSSPSNQAGLVGVDGNIVVGNYYGDTGASHGIIYNMSNQYWFIGVSLDVPGAISTSIGAIDGINIVGNYIDSSGGTHGFLYNGFDWLTLDVPGTITGISGNSIVGTYHNASGPHGFLYTIPEPCTIFLLGTGGIICLKNGRKNRVKGIIL